MCVCVRERGGGELEIERQGRRGRERERESQCYNNFPFLAGEYVALYQTQRESLKAKFVEKDLFIERLTSEKATIQVRMNNNHACLSILFVRARYHL